MSAVAVRRRRAALGVLVALGLCMLAAGGLAGAQSPAAPSVTVVAGDGALTVQWTAPAGATGIVSYDLRFIKTSEDETDDNNWTEVIAAWKSGPLHYVLAGLDNGTGYDVQVRAMAASSGDWSDTAAGTPADHGDNRSAATTLSLGVPAGGTISSSSDVDYFKFTVSGTRRVLAYTTGDTDTSVRLLDAARPLRSGGDAFYLAGAGNEVVWDSLSPGTYYVEVSGSGGATGDYVLRTVGVVFANTTFADAVDVEVGSATHGIFDAPSLNSPVPEHFYRLVLAEATDLVIRTSGLVSDTVGSIYDAGESETHYNDDGYAGGQTQFLIRARLEEGTHYISVSPLGADDRGPYLLHVDEAVEGGSSTSNAVAVPLGGVVAATFDTPGDVDYFRLDLDRSARVEAVGVSADAGLRGTLLDSGGSAVGAHSHDRDFRFSDFVGFSASRTLAAGTYYLRVETVGWTSGQGEPDTVRYAVGMTEPREYRDLVRRCAREVTGVSDPLYGCQWHLDNIGGRGGTAGEDINIGGVWQTATGTGVNVAVVDDGVDNYHEDLSARFDADASHDYTGSGSHFSSSRYHGTAVAGIIAAEHNSAGVRGVAPGARIRSFNVLRRSTMLNEADAMARERATTAVSSNSWGPPDDGWPHRAPRIWEQAIDSGLAEGHGGLGTVYAWAGGNGGPEDDSGLDEFANHYGVMAVCAVDNDGNPTHLAEPGSNLWVCAPSESALKPGITTTDVLGGYLHDFGGTSAATPQVSGVAALVRSANTLLTWRDVKLIVAGSARKNDPGDSGWLAGASKYGSDTDSYEFNHSYGFGVVDAEAAVTLAQGWTRVPEMLTQTAASTGRTLTVPERGTVRSPVSLDPGIEFVEYVEVKVLMSATWVRELRIELESPSGRVSTLMHPDRSSVAHLRVSDGYFRLGSARHLGEDAEGEWRLRITDTVTGSNTVYLHSWLLTVYGHRSTPGPPAITSVVGGTSDLTVAWDAPAVAGASAVTGYDVRHIRSDAADKSDANWTVADSGWTSGPLAYTIASLTPGVDKFDVQVRAVNSSGDGTWSTAVPASLESTVNTPRFGSSETGVRSVAENTLAGVAIGAPIAATDADQGDILTYSATGLDAAAFRLDASTGQLRTRRALDSETQDRYEFVLTVADHLGLTDEIDVTVNVTDIDEAPQLRGSSRRLSDELTGTYIGSYRATDPEGADVVWSLSGPDAARFTIGTIGEPDSLLDFLALLYGSGYVELLFAEDPDFEARADDDGDNVFEVTVEATAGPTTALDVEVTLRDVDEFPEISGEDSVVFDEGGSGEVASFGAVDPEGKTVSWRQLAGPDRGLFSFVGGILGFVVPPDFENPRDGGADNIYNVTVRALEGYDSSSKDVAVTVVDIDEAGSVVVSPPQGSVSAELTAELSDPDGGVAGLAWRWESSSDGSSWSVISGAGGARYTPVSGDLGQRLRVTASYSDGEGSGKSARAEAGTVLDAPPANYDPRFALAAVGREVAENTAAGRAFGAPVAAVDAENNSLTYSLGGADAASFAIDAPTGQLRAGAALDHEQSSSYSLEVSVHDSKASDGSSDPSVDDTVAVAVTVTGVDEAPTLDEIDPDDFEENGVGVVARFSGVDPEGRSLLFALGGADAGKFWMTPAGVLRFRSPPDHDDPGDRTKDNVYQLAVRASDGPNTASRDVTVTVTDVDEAPTPRVTSSGSFAENGTGPAARLTAQDPEKGQLAWRLSGADSGVMSISAMRVAAGISSAWISFDDPPDFEARAAAGGENLYQVTASVTDGTNEVSQDVSMLVVDVDEAPTITGEADVGYDEDRTDAVQSYAASDPETVPVTWSLSGVDEGVFDLSEAGVLSFEGSHVVDFENPGDINRRNDYSVTVRASDGTNIGELAVTVRVGNVDEPGAIGLSSQQPQEGAALSATVSDPDGSVSAVVWVWEKSSDGTSGWALISGASSGSYTPGGADVGEFLRVSATYRDGHGSNKSASAQPTEAVRTAPPLNQAPQFPTSETGQRSVPENEPRGTAVGSPVAAVDDDANDTVAHSLRGAGAAGFSIDSASGQISTGGPLNREDKSSYSFTVRATDASGAYDDVTVRVTVDDVDEDPVLNGPTRVNYAENRTDTVAEYEASDPEGNPVAWSLEGAERVYFSVVGGDLEFRSSPDFEQPAGGDNSYSVTVVASDGLKSARRAVQVVVTGVDEAPVIRGSRSVQHLENTASVGLYQALDPEGESVELSLEGSDVGLFVLGADGALSFKLAPDFEQRGDADRNNVYEVTLAASDGARRAEAEVRVTVVDGDDFGSVVLSPAQPVVGAAVTATLSDPDGAVSDAVWIWERSPDDQDWVEIDGAGSSRYVPPAADSGQYLRATATYTDQLGPDKVAQGRSLHPVTDTPPPPPPPPPPGPGPPGPGPTEPTGGEPAGPRRAGFADVDPGSVHASSIEALFASGVTVGCATEEPLRFCPDDAVTRAQMATFLARALGLEVPEVSAGFGDVDPGSVHASSIEALFASGVTVGCATEEPLRFCPDDAVTRAQMATFLARALGLEVPEVSAGFGDVDPGSVHASSIEALFASGVTVGCATEEPLRFCPDDAVTRAQMASFLIRALTRLESPS